MPAMQSAVMQAKSGRDTVRSSFTTTVRSGGTLPPVTTINKFVRQRYSNLFFFLENLLFRSLYIINLIVMKQRLHAAIDKLPARSS